MAIRYLFGPVTATFANRQLRDAVASGDCLPFNHVGDVGLTIGPNDRWQDVVERLPEGWRPDALVLSLTFASVPNFLWAAPVPIIGLAANWDVLFHYYRWRLPTCDVVAVDAEGVDVFRRAGIDHARPLVPLLYQGQDLGLETVPLAACPPVSPARRLLFARTGGQAASGTTTNPRFGAALGRCGGVSVEDTMATRAPAADRDIDIGAVVALSARGPDERLPWLASLARFSDRWRVSIGGRMDDGEYAAFLRRSRIVYNYSVRGGGNERALEAAAAGALVFLERSNRDVAALFEDRRECVLYGSDDLEALLEYYLTHEDERAKIAAAGQERALACGFTPLWRRFMNELEADWPAIVHRAQQRRPLDGRAELLARMWQAISSDFGSNPQLTNDLQEAFDGEHGASDYLFAGGILSWLGEANAPGVLARGLGPPHPGPRVPEYRNPRGTEVPNRHVALARISFEKILAAEPDHPLALLNLVEVLAGLGETDKAVALARRGLVLCARGEAIWQRELSLPHYPPVFDDFRVRWEAAAWQNAGDADRERDAKKALVRGRLHAILATLTKDLTHFQEAAFADPTAPTARLALGCALGRAGRPAEAAVHLEVAHRLNPFDAVAARTLHQAFVEIGARAEAENLVATRRQLARAAPQAVALEAWFAAGDDRSPDGGIDESRPRMSLCMIVKNEEHNLGDCLQSVADLVDEIVVVDTGSTDKTKEIAAKYGAKIFDFPWIDSFSAARNESLRHASGRWIFWLDADDRIDEDNRRKLRPFIETLGNENLAFVMKCRCLAQHDAQGPTVVDHIRLFRNHPELRWEHRIHEQILPSLRRHGASVKWTDIVITHTGYVDHATVRRKQERDLKLLLLEREELNDHPFTLFNLGSTYLELGMPKTALPVLKRSLERSAPSDSITRKLYVLIAQTLRKLSQLKEALDVCTAGRKHFPHNAELLFHEACLRDELGDLAGARRCLETALQTSEERHFASVSEGLTGPQIRHRLGQLCAKEGDSQEAQRHLELGIATSPEWMPLWVELGQLYLNAQRWADLDALGERMEQSLGPTMEGRVLCARGRLAQGAFAEAIQSLRLTIERHPKAVWPRVILSHALLQQGTDFGAAELALKDVLALEPGNQEASRNLRVLQESKSRRS